MARSSRGTTNRSTGVAASTPAVALASGGLPPWSAGHQTRIIPGDRALAARNAGQRPALPRRPTPCLAPCASGPLPGLRTRPHQGAAQRKLLSSSGLPSPWYSPSFGYTHRGRVNSREASGGLLGFRWGMGVACTGCVATMRSGASPCSVHLMIEARIVAELERPDQVRLQVDGETSGHDPQLRQSRMARRARRVRRSYEATDERRHASSLRAATLVYARRRPSASSASSPRPPSSNGSLGAG